MPSPKTESDHFLHRAIVAGDIRTVSEYLAAGHSANVLDAYDCEPLYTAVKYDRLRIAKMLLAAGGNIFRKSRFRGEAFGAACWNWNLRMIDFCLKAGVDINQVENGRKVLDSLNDQKSLMRKAHHSKWQVAYDKLVAMGAVHAKDLQGS